MRIAQVAPLSECVPPKLYGGTERIVSYLTEELVRQGHDVTLFASADSETGASLVPCTDIALRLNPAVKDHLPYHIVLLDQAFRRASDFYVLHFHIDLLHFPLIRQLCCPSVTTLHGRLDLPDLKPLYAAFPYVPIVSISRHQRRPLPAGLLSPQIEPQGSYLAFLGRISPEKRPDRAIEIALRSGLPLKIAAKIDRVDRAYWSDVIEPLVRAHPSIDYIGEIGEHEKPAFLGNARALLFPIDWPEPFGLVMIEAMACGTPVIAFRSGSVPEVIEDGTSGFVVRSVEEAIDAVSRLDTLRRGTVRAAFERRFTVERMALDYLKVYRDLPGRHENARQRQLDVGLQAVA